MRGEVQYVPWNISPKFYLSPPRRQLCRSCPLKNHCMPIFEPLLFFVYPLSTLSEEHANAHNFPQLPILALICPSQYWWHHLGENALKMYISPLHSKNRSPEATESIASHPLGIRATSKAIRLVLGVISFTPTMPFSNLKTPPPTRVNLNMYRWI